MSLRVHFAKSKRLRLQQYHDNLQAHTAEGEKDFGVIGCQLDCFFRELGLEFGFGYRF